MARVLIVSSFVEPHVGGVEQFVSWARDTLNARGHEVRVLAGNLPGAQADITLPTKWMGPSDWPLPVGGVRRLHAAVKWADVVLLNGHRHVLTLVATAIAAHHRRRCVFFIHTASEVPTGSVVQDGLGALFDTTLSPFALRRSTVVAVSDCGMRYVNQRWGLDAARLPYPARATGREHRPALPADGPFRIVWAGRLTETKAPADAVAACERLAAHCDVELHVYGDGPGRAELLKQAKPFVLLHGQRPWLEVVAAQCRAHACLSSSIDDNVQLSLLEPLARGVPCVSTAVGDAALYYDSALAHYNVPAGQPERTAAALHSLVGSYETSRVLFASNSDRLRAEHGDGHPERALADLVELQPKRAYCSRHTSRCNADSTPYGT